MPRVVSVWCRQLGHDVLYTTYFGQEDPISLLPEDLDIVFISGSSQASALAYALAKLYRQNGVLTVAGGPHAKCFPEDCKRFFDFTVTQCDKQLVADILDGQFDPPTVLKSEKPLTTIPSIEERLPEIEISAFHNGRPTWNSVVSILGSMGYPYDCNFCTDWNSTYLPISADQLALDLEFIATNFSQVFVGFHDPNFGVRFDEQMEVMERIEEGHRSRFLMECSLSVLTDSRLRRLKKTRCLYVAPGIESWTDYGNKMRMTSTQGQDRVSSLSEKFSVLHNYIPGLQANFVFGLDSDFGSEPFDLTLDFLTRLPFVWPNINILTPYGGTPIYDQMIEEGRLLKAMPLALYCSPYVAIVLKNYGLVDFYDALIRLLSASIGLHITLRRAFLRDHPVLKLARLGQTLAVRRDIHEMRLIKSELETNAQMRAFHEGRQNELPSFYAHHLERRLGRYAGILSPAEISPLCHTQ